jgi:hypothetical protein
MSGGLGSDIYLAGHRGAYAGMNDQVYDIIGCDTFYGGGRGHRGYGGSYGDEYGRGYGGSYRGYGRSYGGGYGGEYAPQDRGGVGRERHVRFDIPPRFTRRGRRDGRYPRPGDNCAIKAMRYFIT